MIRDIWRAASRPEAFFARLEPLEPHILRAASAALLSVGTGLVTACFGFLRLTNSNAPLPIFLAGLGAGLVTWLLVWFLGGLVLVRPGRLDIRAWELAAWSWVPAGVLAVSLLPVVLFFPLPSLLLGYLGLLVWHLFMLRAGLIQFAPANIRRAFMFYLLALIVFPWGLGAWLLFVFAPP